MRAFTNTIETKEQAITAAEYHRTADKLVQGSYGAYANTQGCSVGCTYRPYEERFPGLCLHKISEPVHGIPVNLTYMRDRFFEILPKEKAVNWHVDFVSAIPPGADLSKVVPNYIIWSFSDPEHGLRRHVKADSDAAKNIDRIVVLYQRRASGEEITPLEWAQAAGAVVNGDMTPHQILVAARQCRSDAYERYWEVRRRLGWREAAVAEAVAEAAVAEAEAAVAEAEAAVAEAVAEAEAAVAEAEAEAAVAEAEAEAEAAEAEAEAEAEAAVAVAVAVAAAVAVAVAEEAEAEAEAEAAVAVAVAEEAEAEAEAEAAVAVADNVYLKTYAHYVQLSADKLLQLMRDAPVTPDDETYLAKAA